MDRFVAMRTFVEIVDRGSLTAAAEILGKSQPAVVRTLAALEAHLGVVLLQRTTRRMALTPDGRDYLERARRILADLEEAESALRRAEAEPRGRLRMTAPVQFGQLHVAPLMAQLLERHEELEVDLLLLDRVVDMIEEAVDLSLRIGPLADSSLVALPVDRVDRVLCASPSFIARHGAPADVDALAHLPMLALESLTRRGIALRVDGRSLTLPVEGRFCCNSIAAGIEACIAGAGVAQFLSYQVQEALSRGQLVALLPDCAPESWPVSLVYPSRRLTTARLRSTVEFLREALPPRLGSQASGAKSPASATGVTR